MKKEELKIRKRKWIIECKKCKDLKFVNNPKQKICNNCRGK